MLDFKDDFSFKGRGKLYTLSLGIVITLIFSVIGNGNVGFVFTAAAASPAEKSNENAHIASFSPSSGSSDPNITCGSTITQSTTLTANIGPCNLSDGLKIGANNINLNCNGHSIIGRNESNAIIEGIKLISHSGVTIRNCMVVGFNGDAFHLENATGNTLVRNNATNNNGTGFALIESSNNNTVARNNATRNQGSGFFLSRSSNNTVTRNIAANNLGFGFDLAHSPNNILDGNKAIGNDLGIQVFSSDNTTLTRNTATINKENGFLFSLSGYNTVARNNATRNDGSGFDLANFFINNTLTRNTVTGNGQDGFDLFRADNNTLTRNAATGNNGSGFSLGHFASNNTLTRNNATLNIENGFSLDVNTNSNLLSINGADNNSGFGYSDASNGESSSTGTTAGTANIYKANECNGNGAGGSSPNGLCTAR
jgi:parallel beta-helix repeat protein